MQDLQLLLNRSQTLVVVELIILAGFICLFIGAGVYLRMLGKKKKYSEQALRKANQDLQKSQSYLDSMIENIPNMVFVKDAKTLRFVRFNRAGEQLLGHSRAELLGKNDYDFFPEEQADFFTEKDRAVLAGKHIVDIPEEPIETRHFGKRILHTRKIPIFGVDGRPEYLLGISEDITEWKRAEAERLKRVREQIALEERERAAERTAFLAEASTLLASSLDFHETLKKLADLAVPKLADWCTVTIVREDSTKKRVAAVHKDKEKVGLIEELSLYYPVESDATEAISKVIETGKPLINFEVNDKELVSAAKDERHLQIMRELGCASCMIVPLEARGKIHGALTFISSSTDRIYNAHDAVIAEELGRRAAVAIDNAFLYESAQKAIRSRDEFLSIASHELKTPLTSLLLSLQIARKQTNPEQNLTPSPAKLAKTLDSSTAQVNRITALIDDLLDVSRIEAGRLSFNFEPFDLAGLIREMGDQYHEHVRAAGCKLSIVADSPVFIKGDRYRMEQVVVNLLTNAAKYGEGKPIELKLNTADQRASIHCKDQGMGIPKNKLEKVFERFERAVSPNNISGLGLGLYITSEIVKGHHGKIYVESELGAGSTFVVELPVIPEKYV